METKKALKLAFPHTIPIMTGFIFLGIAFGFLMKVKGLSILWTLMLSICTFAGSMQFVAVTLLCAAFNPVYALILTLMVNARHLFYGISMLDKFRDTGKYKIFLIFSLCDETFSLLCSCKPPKEVEPRNFMFWIAFLNYLYWIIGSILGGLLGSFISFDTTGLDFVLTALFVVIFLNQWNSLKHHISPLIGIGCSIFAIVIFGPDQFIIPAMLLMIVIMFIVKRKYQREDFL